MPDKKPILRAPADPVGDFEDALDRSARNFELDYDHFSKGNRVRVVGQAISNENLENSRFRRDLSRKVCQNPEFQATTPSVVATTLSVVATLNVVGFSAKQKTILTVVKSTLFHNFCIDISKKSRNPHFSFLLHCFESLKMKEGSLGIQSGLFLLYFV